MYRELLVTKKLIQLVTTQYKPIRSFDFFGYIVPYNDKKKYLVAVWMNGQFMLFPADPKYKLSKFKAKRMINKLIKAGMLEYDIVVFDDMDERKNIPYNKDAIVRIPEYFFFPPDAKH